MPSRRGRIEAETSVPPALHPRMRGVVAEHWNNGEERLYGRNLGRDEDIELVRVGA